VLRGKCALKIGPLLALSVEIIFRRPYRTIYSERLLRYKAEISASRHFRESAGGAERMTEDCDACAKGEASQRACLSPL
jgi:hypothetical protein